LIASYRDRQPYATLPKESANPKIVTVRMKGFEPSLSSSPNLRFCQTKLHPEKVEKMGIEPTTDWLQTILAPLEHASP
jgi:hypothetical protein